jgi:hypothetical protein
MRALALIGLGECKEGRLRDTFRLDPTLPGIGHITDRPGARNHLRSEDGGFLLRAPAATLREALGVAIVRLAREQPGKGLEFALNQLTPEVLDRLFVVLQDLAGASDGAAAIDSTHPAAVVKALTRSRQVAVPRSRIVKGTMDYDFDPGEVDQGRALIYCWRIVDHGGVLRYCYVGKAEGGARRALNDYAKNVNNLLNGRPYRRGKPADFRLVHRRMADAVRWQWPMQLQLVRNVEMGEDIFAVESFCSAQLGYDRWPPTGDDSAGETHGKRKA